MFRLTRDDVSPALSRMAALARNPERVLRAMGTTFKSITEGTFNSAGSAYRPRPWPAKVDGSPSILQKSTTLAKSFQLEVTSTSATVSNPMVYAAVHQFGAKIEAKHQPYLRFKVGERWASKKSVTIPARPFFPVEDGRLTPAAEEKIRAAGEREMAKQAAGGI